MRRTLNSPTLYRLYYISLEAVEQRTWFASTAAYLIGPQHSLGYKGWSSTSYLHPTFVIMKWLLYRKQDLFSLLLYGCQSTQGVNTEPCPQSLNTSATSNHSKRLMNDEHMTTRFRRLPMWQLSKLYHASTSQSLLEIDQLTAELEESQWLHCIQQHYGCIVAIACKIFYFIGR